MINKFRSVKYSGFFNDFHPYEELLKNNKFYDVALCFDCKSIVAVKVAKRIEMFSETHCFNCGKNISKIKTNYRPGAYSSNNDLDYAAQNNRELIIVATAKLIIDRFVFANIFKFKWPWESWWELSTASLEKVEELIDIKFRIDNEKLLSKLDDKKYEGRVASSELNKLLSEVKKSDEYKAHVRIGDVKLLDDDFASSGSSEVKKSDQYMDANEIKKLEFDLDLAELESKQEKHAAKKQISEDEFSSRLKELHRSIYNKK